jgi:ABC-type branched-subunit amino acid transport system ATPase component/branched-subunit amino acid ABC-type transport system permease component
VDQYIVFGLTGLGLGVIYAAIASGVVITYRGTGIINFAIGAMAAWGVYVYDELRRTGDIVVPVVGIDHRLHLIDRPSFAVCFTIALGSCAALGLGAHLLVFRPLRNAPILARVVASVGLLLTVQALIGLQFGTTPRAVAPIVPAEGLTMGGITLQRDRLWLTAAMTLVATVLWAFFRFTRSGLAMRALAESERAVALARHAPLRLGAATWVLSSVVVGGLVILAAPTTVLTPSSFTLAIVPALAAALVGRLQSISVTVVAALALGSAQSITQFLTTKPWWPEWAAAGLADVIPLLVIVAALFAVGHSLPARGALEAERLPDVTCPRLRPRVVGLCIVLAAVALVTLDGGYRFGLITSLSLTVVMLSIVVLTGLVGQISLAQAAVAGSAGFALSKLFDGLPFPASMLLAASVAAAFGVVVGIPALRIRGAQLTVVTLAVAVAIERLVFRNPSFTPSSGNLISDPSLFGVDLGVREGRTIARVEFGFLVLAVCTVACVGVANLARSPSGRRFLAVRSNERASAAVGIDVAATKLTAFAMASFLAGIGGCLIGYSRGQLSADSFSTNVSLLLLAFAYLGGITSLAGAVTAGLLGPLGLVFVVLDRNLDLGNSYALIAGIALVATAILNPVGIAGTLREGYRHLSRRLDSRRAAGAEQAPSVAATTSLLRPATARPSPHPGRPDLSDGPTVLQASAVTVRYAGLTAVDDVTLRLCHGQIVGLIGPNGAGKTTLVDAMSGFVDMDGSVALDGRNLTGEPPHRRAQAGLARTWQLLGLFADLSVEENLWVAAEPATLSSGLRDLVAPGRARPPDGVDRALELMDLNDYRNRLPRELSLGHQKLVGVARALAARPRVVLLDEPAAGLDNAERQVLGEHLLQAANGGVAMLLIDHDVQLVLDVCDYVYVLDSGRLIAQGTASHVRTNEDVVNAYLGTKATA